jgi:hypothetical protein
MASPEDTSLVIGCCEPSSHRAQSVLDGTLSIPDCSIRFVKLGPGEMLLRSFADPELNVAELSLSSYVTRMARNDCPYVVLPVHTPGLFAFMVPRAHRPRHFGTGGSARQARRDQRLPTHAECMGARFSGGRVRNQSV